MKYIFSTPLQLLASLSIVFVVACAKEKKAVLIPVQVSAIEREVIGPSGCFCEYRIIDIQNVDWNPYWNAGLNTITGGNIECQGLTPCPLFNTWYSSANCPGSGSCLNDLSGSTLPTAFFPFNCNIPKWTSFESVASLYSTGFDCLFAQSPNWTMTYEIRCTSYEADCQGQVFSSGLITAIGGGTSIFIPKKFQLQGCGCVPVPQ